MNSRCKNPRAVVLGALLFAWCLCCGTTALGQDDYTRSPAYQKNLMLIQKAARERNWAFVIERGLEILRNAQADPQTLKQLGTAAWGVGERTIALNAFRAGGLLGRDAEVDALVAPLTAILGELVLVYENPPPRLAEAPLPTVSSTVAYAPVDASGVAALGLTLEGESRVRTYLEEIERLTAPAKPGWVGDGGPEATVTVRDIKLPAEGCSVQIDHRLASLGLPDVRQVVVMKPRASSILRVKWTRLAIPDLLPSDLVEVDGRPMRVGDGNSLWLLEGKHRVTISRSGLKALSDLQVAGSTMELTYRSLEGEVSFQGWKAGTVVRAGGHPVLCTAGLVRLPHGEYRLTLERPDWRGQSVGFNANVQAGKILQFLVPAFVAVAVDVPDVVVQFSRDKTSSSVQGGIWSKFVEEAGPVRLVVSSGRYETRVFDLEVSPGSVHDISLVDGGLVLKKEWADFDQRLSNQRTKGWLWLSSGAAGLVVSGVLVLLWQDNRRQADNAYSLYLSASDVQTVKTLRAKVADFDQKAGTYQWTGLTVGTLGLGAAGVGLYYLLFGPEPPSAKAAMASDGGCHATPWIDLGTDGGLVFGLSSWF